MEFLIILVLITPIAAFAALVVALVALARIRRKDRETEGPSSALASDYEGRLGALEDRIGVLERGLGPAAQRAENLPQPVEEAPAPIPPTRPTPPIPDQVPAPQVTIPEEETPKVEAPAVESLAPPPATGQPSTPAPPATAAADPSTAPSRIDWERWIGVRGAAAAGGIIFALAALLLFKYSIEHGLVSPMTRVVMGILFGLGCVVVSEWVRSRRYTAAADALAGAGIVALYAALWAAHTLYGLLGPGLTFALMVLVTVCCGALSARHRSLFIAVLGLVGGFATPLLVTTNIESPVALFSWVLLLDAGLLILARRRGWPTLALLALIGTAIHQALWLVTRMGPETATYGLLILGLFAVVFAVACRDQSDRIWKLVSAGAVLLPFALALQLLESGELSPHPAPLGALLALLSGAALWLAHSHRTPLLANGAAGASAGLMCGWFLTHHPLSVPLAWEGTLVCFFLALVFHLPVEIGRTRIDWRPLGTAAIVVTVILLALLALAPNLSLALTPSPWLLGWVLLAGLLVRQAVVSGREWLQLVAAAGVSAGFFLVAASSDFRPLPGTELISLAAAVIVAMLFQALGLVRRQSPWADRAAAAAGLGLLFAVFPVIVRVGHGGPTPLLLVVSAALGLLSALAAGRLRSGGWYLATVLMTAAIQGSWTLAALDHPGNPSPGLLALGLQLLTVVVLGGWPLLEGRALRSSRLLGVAAASTGLLWLPSLRSLWIEVMGRSAVGLLPLLLATFAVLAIVQLRRVHRDSTAASNSAVAWFCAAALGLVSLAIPLQLAQEWITIGWALNGFAVLVVWKRLDHPGLKYFGLVLLAAAAARLVINPAVLGYHSSGSWPVLNWLAYTYLVPAAALLGSAWILSPLEIGRLRSWEPRLAGDRTPFAAGACGLSAVVVVFAWINLTIAEAFSVGSEIVLILERLPARDLATSLSWAGYSLVLLMVGMRREGSGLRWLSLGGFLLTILKVFLHDLGELEDLYRVASLVGLAASLILVSLVYQRFAFRSRREEES